MFRRVPGGDARPGLGSSLAEQARNTGSTGYAALWNNYVQVNVIDDPLRLVIQNIEAVEGGRKLQAGIYCWIKEMGA